jgi:aldehyde dehydrogenase (NAD+)
MKVLQHYIDGRWTAPIKPGANYPVINPATEEAVAEIRLGSEADIDLAAEAAHRAFPAFAATPLAERIEILQRLRAVFMRRFDDMVSAITTEMGAPYDWSKNAQAASGPGHIDGTIEAAKQLDWETRIGKANIVREPIGVCGLITPWNWPINQIMAKVAPALVTGCTMVLKPSEQAPLSALLMAEFIDEIGLPKGVFNMVYGMGPVVGHAMSAHPKIDLMSFTGSTRAGVDVAKTSADTVKRVTQELGGKSANIVFADVDLDKAIKQGVRNCFSNTGQSCNAPTRMLVEDSVYDRAVEIAVRVAHETTSGDPTKPGRHLGPLASRMQFEKVQKCIAIGIEEGGRSWPARWHEPRLLRAPHHLCGCAQPDADCARRNLRAGAQHAALQDTRRCRRDRQRHAVWTCRLRADKRYEQGTCGFTPSACGERAYQWCFTRLR